MDISQEKSMAPEYWSIERPIHRFEVLGLLEFIVE